MRRARLVDAGVVAVLAGASLLLGVNGFLYGPINRKVSSLIDGEATQGVGGRAAQGGDVFGHMVALWWGFAVLCALGFLLRRRWPLTAVGLAAVGSAGHVLASLFPFMPLDLALPVALYTLAVQPRSPWHSRIATGTLVLATYVVSTLVEVLPDGWPFVPHNEGTGARATVTSAMYSAAENTIFGAGLVLVLAFALGEASRLRRVHVAVLEQRSADLARERDQRSALAIAAERARITRELHDVVAHGLSVVVIQAQGAAAALRSHPDRAERALGEVIATGRSSLAEMRRLLGVVRRDPGEDPDLAPQPGVGALPDLVDQVRATGTLVAFVIDGEPAPLPSGVDLSVYRIVQEALTNVLKHAGTGARARVRIGFAPDAVQIQVSDDGTGPPTDDPACHEGHGLRGIAERVGMLGGQWSAGARPGGGFALHARLPLADKPVPAPAPAPVAPR